MSRRSEGRNLRGAGEQLIGYQQELGQQQAAESRLLEAQIAAMGRPQMQAEVQRLQEIADITGMQARTGMPAAAMEAAQQNIEIDAARMALQKFEQKLDGALCYIR